MIGPRRLLPALVLLGGAVACSGPSAAAWPVTQLQGIQVQGEGTVQVTPDLALERLGAEISGDSADDVQNQVNDRMNRVIDRVSAAGVDKKDIKTVQASLSQRDIGRPEAPRRTWTAINVIQITVRKISDAGKVVDAATAAGANRIDGISYAISDPAASRKDARDKAMADARARADQIAQAAGVRVGKPISVSESSSGVVPLSADRGVAVAAAAPSPAPVEVGQSDVRITVQVVYSIQ